MPRKSTVPKTRGGGKYTESQYYGLIRAILRNSFNRWPPKWEILNAASRPYKGPDKRKKKEYQCALCTNWFTKADVEVDHYPIGCGPCNSPETIGQFAINLRCESDNLRVLCIPCHKLHTKTTREESNGQ